MLVLTHPHFLSSCGPVAGEGSVVILKTVPKLLPVHETEPTALDHILRFIPSCVYAYAVNENRIAGGIR